MARSKTNHAQHSFAAGELSPRLEMRDDLPIRGMGVSYLENFYCLLQGPIRTSRGTEYTAQASGSNGRLFPFYINTFTGFVVLVTPTTVYVSDQDGFVAPDNLVSNGDFLSLGADWTDISIAPGDVTFVSGSAEFQPGNNGRDAGIRQNILVTPGDNHQLTIQVSSGTGPMVVSAGTTAGGTDILAATTFTGTNTIVVPNLPSTTNDFWLDMVVEGAEATKRIAKVELIDTDLVDQQIQFDSPWATVSDIYGIQAKMAPGTLDLYLVGGGVPPQILAYDKTTAQWSFGPATFTNLPIEWAGANWPKVIDFHDGRLYLASTPDQPEDFWATRPGSSDEVGNSWERYTDFDLGADATTVVASHAIHYTMDRRGDIRWMESQKNLLIGTENAEFMATGSTGIIVPGDIQTYLQSTFGSAISQATVVGNEVMFISVDRRKVRSIGYEDNRDQFVSKDITIFADHITGDGNYITEMHYSPNPDSVLTCTTNLGTVLLCTYDTESKIGGWARRSSQGVIRSACVLPYAGQDEVWVLVDREVANENLYVEKTIGTLSPKMDSFVLLYVDEDAATTSWSAPHLAGKTCQVLADGAVHADVDVEADGSFETQYAVSRVIVGLGVTSTMITMSLGSTIQFVGTSRAMAKRWTKLYARITASWNPIINGHRSPTRRATTPMGEMEPADTKTVKVSNLGWDADGKVTIVQDICLPTLIAGYFGELTREQV